MTCTSGQLFLSTAWWLPIGQAKCLHHPPASTTTAMYVVCNFEIKSHNRSFLFSLKSSDYSYEQRLQLVRHSCSHLASHYLGMDVHDTNVISRKIKLQPNMVVTAEPGIYIPENNYEANPEFHGIGILIEDNILLTESQPVILSASCPKQVEEIEDLMSRRWLCWYLIISCPRVEATVTIMFLNTRFSV